MTLPRELLEAIAARPDERAGYLVAADWLVAQGHPWGELIAAQARLQGETDPATFLALRRRADALIRQHADRWLGAPGLEATWRWGFVERLVVAPELVPAVLASEVGALARELVLEGTAVHLSAALQQRRRTPSPPEGERVGERGEPPGVPSRLEALTLRSRRAAQQTVTTPLPHVRRLDTTGVALDWAALPPSVVELRVADIHPSDALSQWLEHEAPSTFARLELLDLELAPRVVRALVERQAALKTLHVEDDLPDELARWLAEAPALSKLEHLALGGPATDDGLEAILTHAARFSRLSTLVLYGGRFGATRRRWAYKQLPRIVFAQRRPAGDWTQRRRGPE